MSSPARTAVYVIAALLAGCASAATSNNYEEFRGRMSKLSSEPGAPQVFRPCTAVPGDTLWLVGSEGHGARDLARLDSLGILNLPNGAFIRLHGRLRSHYSARRPMPTNRVVLVSRVITSSPTGSCP